MNISNGVPPAARAKMNPVRRRISCPDCGHIYWTQAILAEHAIYAMRAQHNTHLNEVMAVAVHCPRCDTHYTWCDFWLEQYKKWGDLPSTTDIDDD